MAASWVLKELIKHILSAKVSTTSSFLKFVKDYIK
jgi:hypothetical protein